MKITIIPSDRTIYVDREACVIEDWSQAGVPPGIHAVQYDTETGEGHVEWVAPLPNMPVHKPQFDAMFGHCLALWQNAKHAADAAAADADRAAREAAILAAEAAAKAADEARAARQKEIDEAVARALEKHK